MKKALLLSLLASSAVMYSSAAHAEAKWPNWYVGLHGSLAFVNEIEVDGNPLLNDFDTDTGWGIGASLGYRPAIDEGNWRNLRFEAEWLHQRSDVGKVAAFSGTSRGSGDIRMNAYMVNMLFDATFRDPGLKSALTPYFGGGVGIAQLQLNNVDGFLGNANEDDNVFAYQLLAGISYAPEIMPQTEWTLGYRYLNLSDAEFANSTGGRMDLEYDSHNIEAGVRFLF